MPAPAVTAAYIGAGSGLLQSLFGIGKGKRNERRNKRLMDYELGLNKQMFDYQNAYNTPKNQVLRMKEAGLNPALMYGQGTTGNATGYPTVARTPTDVTSFDSSSLVDGLTSGAQVLLQKQQVDNLKAQQKETESRTLLNSIDAAVKGGTKEEAKGLVKYQLENLKADNKNKMQSLKNLSLNEKLMNKDMSKKDLDIEWQKINNALKRTDLNWRKKTGLTSEDPMVMRLIWRLAQGSYKTFLQFIEWNWSTEIDKDWKPWKD